MDVEAVGGVAQSEEAPVCQFNVNATGGRWFKSSSRRLPHPLLFCSFALLVFGCFGVLVSKKKGAHGRENSKKETTSPL